MSWLLRRSEQVQMVLRQAKVIERSTPKLGTAISQFIMQAACVINCDIAVMMTTIIIIMKHV